MTDATDQNGSAKADADKIDLLPPDGPFDVGVIDLEFVDQNRPESFDPENHRRVPARVWYPAESVSGSPRPYATAKELEHQIVPFWTESLHMPVEVPSAFDVPSHAYERAAPSPVGKCPTLIFSHGGFAYLQSNTALMEHLASHGYVVISITHPHVSYGSIYADGSVAPFDETIVERVYKMAEIPGYVESFFAENISDRFETHTWVCDSQIHPLGTPHYGIWIDDCLHVVDRVCSNNLPSGAEPISSLIDVNRLGTFGMSMGASATLAAFLDHRVKATVNLDGGQFDTRLTDIEMPIPTLVIHSDRGLHMPGKELPIHSEFAYERLSTMGLDPKVQRFEVKGIGHVGCTDAALMPESTKSAYPQVAAAIGSIDGQTMINIMNDFTKAFFDLHLKEEGTGVGDSLVEKFPEVVDVDLSYIREWSSGKPKPDFMSYTHVFRMNRKAAENESVLEEVRKLDKKYVLAFELEDSSDSKTIVWTISFDPESGFAFGLEPPTDTPDLIMRGDYHEYLKFVKAASKGEAEAKDQPVTYDGDMDALEVTKPAFKMVQAVAAVDVNFPDV